VTYAIKFAKQVLPTVIWEKRPEGRKEKEVSDVFSFRAHNKLLSFAGLVRDLFEALVDFVENAPLVEHLAAVAMLVVVGDVVTQLAR